MSLFELHDWNSEWLLVVYTLARVLLKRVSEFCYEYVRKKETEEKKARNNCNENVKENVIAIAVMTKILHTMRCNIKK